MCQDHDEPLLDLPTASRPAHRHPAPHPTRRSFLGALGVGASALLAPAAFARPARAATFSGLAPVRTAMHVHGSWSEGAGSWELQMTRAVEAGIDVMWMTDHDQRLVADGFLTDLVGVGMVRGSTGALAQDEAVQEGGSVHLVAESADGDPAGTSLELVERPYAWNWLRTSLSGHRLVLTFGDVRVDDGGALEVVVTMSDHPAQEDRPAGTYVLVYRFGPAEPGRHLEDGGLRGVVRCPVPAAGDVVEVVPVDDVTALWPAMLALDNSFRSLGFRATSPAAGSVVDVRLLDLQVQRSRSDRASAVEDQRAVVDAYAPRFPDLQVHPAVELTGAYGSSLHWNLLGLPEQVLPDPTRVTTAAEHFTQLATDVAAQGGLVSWNHPFWAGSKRTWLGPDEQVALRRETARRLARRRLYGAQLLECAYWSRCGVGTQGHLDLLDALWRGGRWVTGTGVTDDHSGQDWRRLQNGFATGVWAAGPDRADLVTALAGGRAYAAHLGLWPGGAVDLLVDDAVPMGAVSVARRAQRTVALHVEALPEGAVVELVQGPVDGDVDSGDPGTTVVATLSAGDLGSAGEASVTVDTSVATFVRPQVRTADGRVVGTGNPTALLRREPRRGVPLPRQA